MQVEEFEFDMDDKTRRAYSDTAEVSQIQRTNNLSS